MLMTQKRVGEPQARIDGRQPRRLLTIGVRHRPVCEHGRVAGLRGPRIFGIHGCHVFIRGRGFEGPAAVVQCLGQQEHKLRGLGILREAVQAAAVPFGRQRVIRRQLRCLGHRMVVAREFAQRAAQIIADVFRGRSAAHRHPFAVEPEAVDEFDLGFQDPVTEPAGGKGVGHGHLQGGGGVRQP